MSLLGLFGSGGLLDSKDSGGLLGKHFSPNMPLLMTGLGMMGGGWGGALPGLQAGMQHQRQAQGVKDWESVIGGMGGGQGAPQPGMPMPAVPSPMPGIGGPSPATPAGGMRAAAGSLPGNYGGDYVNRVVGLESGGNPNARSTTSSATGAGQFINSTWLNAVKKHRPDLAQGRTDQQILSLRTDPNLSREMIAAHGRDNAEFLQSRGLGTGPTEVYAAHNLGPAGAAKVLSAAPDTTLASLLGPEAMRANPHMRNMTARTYLQSISGKMGGGGAPAPQAAGGGGIPSPQQQQAFVNSLPPQEVQALARLAAQNPQVASAILQQKFKAQKPKATTDDIQEYSFARQQGYTGSFMDYTASKRQGSTPRLSFQKQGNDIVGIDQQTGQEVSRVPGDAKTQTPPSGYRWTDDGNLEAIAGGPAIKEQRGQKVDDALSLRGKIEGLPSYKKYADSAPIFNSMVTSSASESRAADLDFIYGLAKIMDPESVVREGEMGLVQGTQSMPENMAGWLNSFIMSGQRLSPEARQEILNLSKRRVDQYRANLESDRKSYGQLGADYGITSPNVLPPMVPISPMPSTGSKQEAKPAQTPRIRPQQVPPSMDKSKLPRVTTQQEYDTLQSGAFYVEVSPDGKEEVFKKP